MNLCSFAITAFRHFNSQANRSRYSFFKTNKKSGSGSKTIRIPRNKIIWTDEQKVVLEAVRNRKSVFITGSAGTGKTFLLEQIIKELKKIHGLPRVYVTAPTGVAACALNGQTLHSFAGIRIDFVDREGLLEMVLSDTKACYRWNKVKALVIDETSMVDAKLFEGLAYVARELRGNEESDCGNKTWGGIQLIVSGDFFQLPPVIKKLKKGEKEFAFEADCWKASFDLHIELTKVFRQSDSLLIQLLQGIRKGESNPDDMALLEGCFSGYEPDPEAVQLFPRVDDVNKVNKEKLGSLCEEIYVYKAQDWGESKWMRQLKCGIAPDELELCVGARVMLIKNKNPWRKLVNGATGTVMNFEVSEKEYGISEMCSHGSVFPLVKFDSGLELVVKPEEWLIMDGNKEVARRRQIPLILSWALSIHKCQGMTLDKLHTDLSRVFGFGMVYVALSRVRSLGGLHLSSLKPSKIKAHPKVLEFYREFSLEQHEKKV